MSATAAATLTANRVTLYSYRLTNAGESRGDATLSFLSPTTKLVAERYEARVYERVVARRRTFRRQR
jgi:hypothetical protein